MDNRQACKNSHFFFLILIFGSFNFERNVLSKKKTLKETCRKDIHVAWKGITVKHVSIKWWFCWTPGKCLISLTSQKSSISITGRHVRHDFPELVLAGLPKITYSLPHAFPCSSNTIIFFNNSSVEKINKLTFFYKTFGWFEFFFFFLICLETFFICFNLLFNLTF